MTQRFRLFPIVIVTAFTVFGLKVTELVRKEEVSFASITAAVAQEKPAADKEPGKKPAKTEDGKEKASQAAMKKDGMDADKGKMSAAEAPKEQSVISLSQSQVALLEALSKRRNELDAREKKVDLSANLLKAAEKRIDDKIKKLEQIRDEIVLRKVQQQKLKNDQFKKLVSIYEGMKPKEAARLFSTLDSDVVLQVAERIAPRKMSKILAKMDAKAAERLTVQLANKASGESEISNELPSIGSGNSG